MSMVILFAGALGGTALLSYLFVKRNLKKKIMGKMEELDALLNTVAPYSAEYEPVYSTGKEFVSLVTSSIEDGKLTMAELMAIWKKGGELAGAIKPYVGGIL